MRIAQYITPILFLWFSYASAQEYWMRTYDHGLIFEAPRKVFLIHDTLYLFGELAGDVAKVGPLGTYLMSLDKESGDVIDRWTYPGRYARYGTVIYDEQNDGFVFVGNYTASTQPDCDHISMISRIDGELLMSNDSIDIVADPRSILEETHALIRYDGQYITAGVLEHGGGAPVLGGFITFFHEDFSVDTTIVFIDSIFMIGRLLIDEGGQLITGLNVLPSGANNARITDRYMAHVDRRAPKIVNSLQFLFENDNVGLVPDPIELTYLQYQDMLILEEEKRIWEVGNGRAIIRAVDSGGAIDTIISYDEWWYDLDEFGLIDLLELSNGEVIGSGVAVFQGPMGDFYHETPCAVRFDVDGQIIWQQMYIRQRSPDDPSNNNIIGGLLSAVEDSEGNLYMTGYFIDSNGLRKPHLIKTGSDGCIEPDCMGYNIITSINRIPPSIAEHIQLYPNPTTSHIQISHDFAHYKVYGSSGRIELRGQAYRAGEELDAAGLSSAVYLFVGYDDEGRLWTERFVVGK